MVIKIRFLEFAACFDDINMQIIGIPQAPIYVSEKIILTESLILQWIPGFNGGTEQTFVIGYRSDLTDGYTDSDPIADSREPLQSYQITGLKAGTLYDIRVYAQTVIGRSEYIFLNLSTAEAELKDNCLFSAGIVLIAISSVLLGLEVMLLAILVIKYKRNGIWCLQREKQNKECQDALPQKADAELHGQDRGNRYETIGRPSAPNVYEELAQQKVAEEQNSAERANTYEILGRQSVPNIYDKLSPHEGKREPQYINTAV